jgi:hypothetical protein
MKPRPVDECLVASTALVAMTRSKLAQLQFSVDSCVTRIEGSADAIAASQALLAKFNGAARNGGGTALAGTKIEEPARSKQTADGSA